LFIVNININFIAIRNSIYVFAIYVNINNGINDNINVNINNNIIYIIVINIIVSIIISINVNRENIN